ncbi:MAG TPA: MarR family transcriptional regulator [Solirubrobacteraceae bacterium]|nr:MarR family transcriptional regulator [Solirubrobacteraceae bacterium]
MGRSKSKLGEAGAIERTLIAALHDLAWLLPRTIDAQAEQDPRLDSLPRSELEIMRLLVRRPGLTVGEVARELGLQRTNASTGIRALVRRGLLASERDPLDGRVARLTPTPLAIRYRDLRERAWATALQERLAAVGEEERVRILECAEPMRALAAALARE